MATPNPIERITLPVQIADRLRSDILAGIYPGGAQLLEAELALTFGVSRGPLREAMQRLVQEGLLRSAPHRGVFVTEVDEDDLLDVFFVRETLETAAIRKICSEGRQGAVADSLTAIAERMDKALKNGDTTAGGDLDFEFHRTLVDAAKSERLSRTYATVQAETRLCLHRLMGGYRSSKDLAEEHFRLAETIRTKDVDAILLELKRHFGDPARHLRKAGGTALT
ncbi:GntR family transcriptional regulator [Nisaea nitritireducens]|uniref:GntR family transcriptional regulator n=1 Tax=Nisaea nitritireducens TaxID=568392 RepID=UPI0018677EB6|nr:GntR family transcriptional regulator [Nisaea nitritireducens]